MLASLANTLLGRIDIAEASDAAARAAAEPRTVGDRRQEAFAHITLGSDFTYLDESKQGWPPSPTVSGSRTRPAGT